MDDKRLIKCEFLETCDTSCPFKHGVYYKHLMHTPANVPGSDTVEQLRGNGSALINALETVGWWISCKYKLFGEINNSVPPTGRIFYADTRDL